MLTCAYQLTSGPCGAPIRVDMLSYSGYSHVGGGDFFHWASPDRYGQGVSETERIFKPCLLCGQLATRNDAHISASGHQFVAAM